MPFDETKEILTKDLEHHADMGAIWPLVFEVVQEGYDVGSARVGV